jgi:hypothetical protein
MRPVPKIRQSGSRASCVSLRAPLPTPRFEERVWHVWIEGGDPVGPASADQIARGIQAGKVPSHASIRHETETFWSDVLDNADVIAALKAVSTESEPPPPPPNPASGLKVAQFLVWIEGGDPVGPVSADQIARGIRAGKVPADASVQRVGDLFASDVLDEADVIAALKHLE